MASDVLQSRLASYLPLPDPVGSLALPGVWPDPTDGQSVGVSTLLCLVGPILVLPLERSMLRAMAAGHLAFSPEADVPGVREPPVESGTPDDD